MEATVVLIILSAAFFVLYMILFFKVWRMTNEIHEFKQQMDPSSIINREICKGSDRVKDVLFDAMWRRLQKMMADGDYNYKPVIKHYKSLYKRANIEFPENVDKIKTPEDYWSYVNGEL